MPDGDETFKISTVFDIWAEDTELLRNYNQFRMRIPTRDQLLKLVELMFMRESTLKTEMSYYLMWSINKAYWTLSTTIFSQRVEELTPKKLLAKFKEVVVYHFLFLFISMNSPVHEDSILNQKAFQQAEKAKVSDHSIMVEKSHNF